MKIIELCANYPNLLGGTALSYVKVRNHYYHEMGIDDITILNFALPSGGYMMDGFEVISLKKYEEEYVNDKFDILICHAPNIRNHYLFLKRYQLKFSNVIFFFHGHEVLSLRTEYPIPYNYQWKRRLSRFVSPIYDKLKFYLWHRYFIKQSDNVHLVFVSEWIRDRFEYYLRLKLSEIRSKSYLIRNGVSRRFEEGFYDNNSPKEYDFITIRSDLDEPKYAVDVVNNLAKSNPQYSFLLIGRGEFFTHFKKAENIVQIERYLTPDEVVSFLNKSRCGLMPTKNDTQGIMACEMATFGMPLITSDIDVCKVVFEGFPNVKFISNENGQLDLSSICSNLKMSDQKIEKFFYSNTIVKEVELLNKIIED